MQMLKRLLLLACLALPTTPGALSAAELGEAIAKVEQIRGHEFPREIEQQTIARKELRKYLNREIERSFGSAERYAHLLEMMQLVDRQPKLTDKLLDLYDAQVLAFYDPRKHVYYSLDELPEGIPQVAMLENLIVIHELTHALQDQVFEAGTKIDAIEHDWDRQMAYHAVIEGEAMLVMLAAAFENIGQSLDDLVANEELLATMAQSASMSPGIPEDVPKYFVESMKFPYLEGLRFVIDAYRSGGWAAVDAIHAAPPISTEEVFHPEIYRARIKAAVETAKPLGLNAASKFVTDVGEFQWRFLLGDKAGIGSDGGTFTIMTDEKQRSTAMILARWDSERDASEFAEAMTKFLKARSINPEVKRSGSLVRVAYGVDRKAISSFMK